MPDWNYTEIKLNRKLPEQLYSQLAGALSRQIRRGDRAGRILPSARKMAKELGISRPTVQKAYDELFRQELVKKKSAYFYQVSARKKTLGQEPFPSIGIILPCRFSALLSDKNCIGAAPYIKGIIDSAMENKLSTVMLELPAFDASQDEIKAYTESLTRRLIGLVHIGGRNHFPDRPLEAVLNLKELPQVFISGVAKYPNIGAVLGDTSQGAIALAENLRAMNHQEIGILHWHDRVGQEACASYYEYYAGKRDETVCSILKNYGLNCNGRYQLYGCSSYQTVLKKLTGLVKSGNMPTAFWCHNDDLARWCIRALRELRYQVPNDISVIGFNGLSGNGDDELTTISLPFYAIGHRSVTQLVTYYKSGITEKNRFVYLKTFLIAGKTLTEANHTEI